MGLAHGRDFFAVEKGARREGYHEIPDMARRVFTRAENKKVFGKEKERLESGLDLETAVEAWESDVRGVFLRVQGNNASNEAKEKPLEGKEKNKGKQKQKEKAHANANAGRSEKTAAQQVDVRLSDDVGNYVCGFMYYISLVEMQRAVGRTDTVFFHIPYLEGEEDIQVGVRVTEGLIRALMSVREAR